MEHCQQAGPNVYGLCRPGIACSLSDDACPADTTCIPDDPRTLSGGCFALAADAGALGQPCALPEAVSATTACSSGACLPADGGANCTALCDLADGGRPYCGPTTQCLPLSDTLQAQQVGECR